MKMKRQKLNKLLLLNAISLLIFVFILAGIEFGFILNIDLAVNSFISKVQTSFLLSVSELVGIIFDFYGIAFFSLLVVLFLWFKHSKRNSVFFALTIIFGVGFLYILKELIQRARPLNQAIIENGFSFPSGHSFNNLLFFGLIIYFTCKSKEFRKFKSIIAILSSLIILIVGFSRLYLNVHWLSDVLGGFAFGLFFLTGSIILKEIWLWKNN